MNVGIRCKPRSQAPEPHLWPDSASLSAGAVGRSPSVVNGSDWREGRNETPAGLAWRLSCQAVADGFVKLLQMAVLPYVTVSID